MLKNNIYLFLQIIVALVTIAKCVPVDREQSLKVVDNSSKLIKPNQEKIIIQNSIVDFQSLPLPVGNFMRNDAKFGRCTPDQTIVHNENIIIENDGPSTLDGVFEFYINSPIRITCIEVKDRMPPGTGATVSLKEGGPGYNWFFLKVQGKYSRGMNLLVTAFGVPDWSKIIFTKQ